MTLHDLLVLLFAGVKGEIIVTDAAGEEYGFTDLAEMATVCESLEDPWVDLVTDQGDAIGVFSPGNADVVEPEPSGVMSDGMIYLFDKPVEGLNVGEHIVAVSDLWGLIDDEDTALYYDVADLNISSPGTRAPVRLAKGRHRQESQGKWKPIESTFGEFTSILRNHQPGKKDGPCFLQGECADGHRKAAAMISNSILGVDLDSGAPLEDVMASIQKSGLEAVIYTTHSHLKNTSVIKRDHFHKWGDGQEATPELVPEYLQEVKGVIPEITKDCVIVDAAQHTSEGIVILVEHQPMPKFRAVFPLKEDFVFAQRGGTQQDAINEWKERYAGFASSMEFFFDEKCVDPARLFYLPRHKKGSPHGSWWMPGDTLDLDEYERVKIKRGMQKRGADNVFSDFGEDEDDASSYITSKGFNLRAWAAKYANRFEMEEMLNACLPDFIRDARTGGKGGTHVECPFEAEHTDFGGGGTYVVNAGDNMVDGFDGGFTFHCVHNACSGRDRLHFLHELLEQEMITEADLTSKEFMLELEGDEAEDEAYGEKPKEEATPSHRDKEVREEDVDDDSLDEEERMLRRFNRRYAIIITSGGVKVLREPSDINDSVSFLSQHDVSLLERNKIMFVTDRNKKTQKIEAFKTWLEWPQRRTYKDVVFNPGKETSDDVYNLFRGWPYEPIKGDWSILRGHIYENICESNDDHYNWFMTWIAHMFQHPTKKPGSTLVITGEKGTGKSISFDFISKLLGSHGITVSQRKQIIGNFNAHLLTTIMMVCEEAFWAADPQAEGVLKDMITNKSMLIERKGYDPIQSDNFTRLVMISNNDWVVPASLNDERRFGVFHCENTRRGDIEFFEGMAHQMENEGGLEALMYDLVNWKPKDGSFGILFTPPLTRHLEKQQIETLTGVHKFMLELIKAGVYESTNDNIEPMELNENSETIIHSVDMRACIEDYMRYRFQSEKAKTSYDDIAKVAQDWFGARETMISVNGATNKKRSVIFPPLAESRSTLFERKGLNIEVMSIDDVFASDNFEDS